MKRDGDGAVSVNMTPLNEWRGSEIWEIQDGRLIALYGGGTGSIDTGPIVASGGGGLWYGNGIPATDASGCGRGHRLDLYAPITPADLKGGLYQEIRPVRIR